MKKYIHYTQQFLSEHIWDPKFQGSKATRKYGLRAVRVLFLASKAYLDDNLPIRASALTYFTMLSIVPVLALGFGIAKGFGLEEVLEQIVNNNLAGQREVADYILTFTKSMVNTTKGGLVAGIGLVVLLWSVFKLLMNIEGVFNTIWNVHSPRSIMRKFTDYFSLVLFAPIMIIFSSSATVFIVTHVNTITSQSELLQLASPAFIVVIKSIPYFIVSSVFTLLFMVMPNTKVSVQSAGIAGIVSGTLFQLFQGAYIFAQTYMSSYNAIYGSFAALPLFLIWLQTSWLIVLFGGELSYALQYEHMKGTAAKSLKTSILARKKYALRLMFIVVRRFDEGKEALTANELASEINASLSVVYPLLDLLTHKHILLRVQPEDNNKEIAFSPAETIDKLSIKTIFDAIEMDGVVFTGLLSEGDLYHKFIELDKLVDIEVQKTNTTLIKEL